MELHPRFDKVRRASSELEGFLLDLSRKYELTLIEESIILSEAIQISLKYSLRAERHGDTEKPANQA